MSGGPGKSFRAGLSLVELMELFPDEDAARIWFESAIWPNGRVCSWCASARTHVASHGNMPYRCSDCRRYFSVKTNTLMHQSNLPLRKWAIAIYLHVTSIKGISSMKLHRDIGITQCTAWNMLKRIRAAWDNNDLPFDGSVEIDETYVGGKERNKHADKKTYPGGGPKGKHIVVGAKNRDTNTITAGVITNTTQVTLHDFTHHTTTPTTTVFTDEHPSYRGINRHHQAVCHSVGQYVDRQAHVNGVESFWALLKRGYHGVYHHISGKHLHRYVSEFCGRHNTRSFDTIDQMRYLASNMAGRRLTYTPA